MATCSLSPNIFPVKTPNSLILSISSPKNSILIPFVEDEAGIISKESPLTLKVPLEKSISFLSYWISISFFIISSLSFYMPTLKEIVSFLYSSGLPNP